MATTYFVWGSGACQIPQVLEGRGTQEAIETSGAHGFRENASWSAEDWAVQVESEEPLEALLAEDPAVQGFTLQGIWSGAG